MKKALAALLLVSPLLASPVFAQTAAPAPKTANSQQSKMGACNAQAGSKKGDERKAFMKECLSSKPAAKPTQQEKMKTCNAQAGSKKGDERKAFMKECLSNKAAP
ncbi:PsiF family protein [Pandoraea terrigena]|uniref:Phosphate starvation-inducible protein PsiF n=1 Tax=Pandoraea terrigena TaxID=2508292 RepID=A0A5E4S5Z8_9BURK|nr:PsiF family protein [Pandoraea terrigena]VVD70543.1 phosphate starvation-inducible protein PsiF [Pandoraea terrigena]